MGKMEERRRKPWSGPRDRRKETTVRSMVDVQLEESAERFVGMCDRLVQQFQDKTISILFSKPIQSNFDQAKLDRLENYLKRKGLDIELFEIAIGDEVSKDLSTTQFHIVFIEDNLDVIKKVKQSEKSKRAVVICVSGSGQIQTRRDQDYSISHLPI